jgi:glutaredoxin
MTVQVYSNGPSCMACRATERRLDRLGIEYEVHRLDQDAALPEWIDATQAPVVVYGEQYHQGFRPDLLDRIPVSVLH